MTYSVECFAKVNGNINCSALSWADGRAFLPESTLSCSEEFIVLQEGQPRHFGSNFFFNLLHLFPSSSSTSRRHLLRIASFTSCSKRRLSQSSPGYGVIKFVNTAMLNESRVTTTIATTSRSLHKSPLSNQQITDTSRLPCTLPLALSRDQPSGAAQRGAKNSAHAQRRAAGPHVA